MSQDISSCRRNLLIASSIIIIFKLAGAKISSVNTLGILVSFERPEYIGYFVWVVMFYELFRFLRISKNVYGDHDEVISKYLKKNETILKIIKSSDARFLDVQEKYPKLERSLFARKILYIANESGHTNQKEIKVNYFSVFIHEMKSDLMYAIYEWEFIEYKLPFYVAIGAIMLSVVFKYIELVF